MTTNRKSMRAANAERQRKREARQTAKASKRCGAKSPRYIVGDDFLGSLGAAREQLAAALQPKKGGRPGKVTR